MTTELKDIAKIILPKDILDHSPDTYLGELRSLVANKPVKLLLDCSELRQTISGHVNILWQSRIICEQAEVPLHLANVSSNLIRVLKILDLLECFNFDSRLEAFDKRTVSPDQLINTDDGLNLEFRCQKSDIKNSRNQFHEYLCQLGLPAAYVYDMETVFYEVAVNISDHSCMAEDQIVKFNAIPKDDRLVLSFTDNGQPFDPTQKNRKFNPSDSANIGQKRGYGLIMIKRMTDKINYRRSENGANILTLEKCWR